jgi:preprotein translocase subunit SecA
MYGFRGDVVRSEQPRTHIDGIVRDVVEEHCEALQSGPSEQAVDELVEWVRLAFPIPIKTEEIAARADDPQAVAELILERVRGAYDLKTAMENAAVVPVMERQIILQSIDTHWQDYLRAMDALRQGVGLRAYGQRDPLVEYKREAFEMFEQLMHDIKDDVATAIFRSATSLDSFQQFMSSLPRRMVHEDASALAGARQMSRAAPGPSAPPVEGDDFQLPSIDEMAPPPEPVRTGPKTGRNDPCPCGSGKKYKKCCGA